MSKDFTCPDSAVRIPANLMSATATVEEITPNAWNPNKMDETMRAKLRLSILNDGFVMPVLVRPNTREDRPDAKWEVVDGEHRYNEAKFLGMSAVPIVNLGPITDEKAQEIMIKANALRGEFDSIGLAEIVARLEQANGKEAIVEALPYTAERIQGMLDLLDTDISDISLPASMTEEGESSSHGGDEGEPDDEDDFKTFDPSALKFSHKCPRCNFEFNPPTE